MKALVISTAFILMMPTVSFANASFSSAADGNVDGSNTKVCQSIPTARPTGGATRARLQVLQLCNTGVRVQQFTKKFNTGGACQSIPPARPTVGATRERLEALQRCNRGVRR